MSVRLCVRPRCARHRSRLVDTQSVHFPSPAFQDLFIPCFLLPWLSWTLTQPSSLTATSEDPPSPLYCSMEEGGNFFYWGSQSLPASSPAPTCSLSASNTPTCRAFQVIFSIFFFLSEEGKSYALLRKV